MNILRKQQPYVFCPPRYAGWFRPVLHLIAAGHRRFKFNIREVRVRGDERVAELAAAGHAVLVAPNHADHADPGLLLQVGARRGIAFHFMAAREGFERSAVEKFVLQRAGAFSVDREGADIAAIKTAMNILREGRHPLVIFPEGEIYHHNEELDVLNEGVATILLRASEKLRPGQKSYAVPTAILIRHDPSVAETFGPRLDRLEKSLTLGTPAGMEIAERRAVSMVERIYRYGGALLAVKEQEFMGAAQAGSLVERLRGLQKFLVEELETKHGVVPRERGIPGRVKGLRQVIRGKMVGQSGGRAVGQSGGLADRGAAQAPALQDEMYRDLDRVFVVQQLYSYPGRYLSSGPTVDRMAETIFKLEEDVSGVQNYPAARRAEVIFGEPIEIGRFLAEGKLTAKGAAGVLTERIRGEIEGLMKG